MSDPLTQIQSSLDELVQQFFTSLNFINTHHDFKVPQGAPSYVSKAEDSQLQTLPAQEFEQSLRAMAKDLVAKSKTIDEQIGSLSNLDKSSADIQALEVKLEEARQEEINALKDRDLLLEECDDLVKSLTEMKSSLQSQ